MLTIALTGNIGSGKSTVADFFSELGVQIIDSDQLAREAVLPGTEALEKIVARFGKDVLREDGQLNRKQIREKIFQQQDARLWLENLLHPIIRQMALQKLDVLPFSSYAIYVVPLLVGREPSTFIKRILLVDTPLETQKARVIARDQIDHATYEAILATQAKRDALLKAADDVIVNDASLMDLKQQVLKLHEKYLTLAEH